MAAWNSVSALEDAMTPSGKSLSCKGPETRALLPDALVFKTLVPKTMMSVASIALFLVLSSSIIGCGPAIYTFNSIPASQILEQARADNAEELAPYEFFTAQNYYEKAQEEAAEANYQDAIRFAERAREYGARARSLARERMRERGR